MTNCHQTYMACVFPYYLTLKLPCQPIFKFLVRIPYVVFGQVKTHLRQITHNLFATFSYNLHSYMELIHGYVICTEKWHTTSWMLYRPQKVILPRTVITSWELLRFYGLWAFDVYSATVSPWWNISGRHSNSEDLLTPDDCAECWHSSGFCQSLEMPT